MSIKSCAVLTIALGIVAGWAVEPARAQLQNGGFENGPLNAVPSNWFTYGQSIDRKVRNTGGFIWNPVPVVKEGNFCYGEGVNGGAGTGGIRQQLPVNVGATYTLSGWYHFGDQNNATHEIGVFNGNVPDATIVNNIGDAGVVRRTNVNGETGWTQFSFNFVPAQPVITIYTKIGATTNSARANWIDGLTLVQQLAGQHTLTGIDPAIIANNTSDTLVTVMGTNLNGVTAVKLVQGATTLTGTGIVVGGGNTSLTATMPTSGEPTGFYDLVVEKPGFDTQTIAGAFLIRDPNVSLLTNGDFNGCNLSGWSVYAGTGFGGGIGDVSAYNSVSIFNPTPLVYEGSCSLRHQEGDNGGEGGVYQVVDVVPGETLELTWVWAGGDQSNAAEFAKHQVGIASGAHVGNLPPPSADLALRSINDVDFNNQAGDFNWTPDSLLLQVPANVHQITVYTRTWHTTTPFNLIATYFDVFDLHPASPCPNQHTTTSVNPAAADTTTPFQIVINGTNLDQVTNVYLKAGPTENPADGWVANPAGTQLTVNFTPFEGGYLPATYSIITEQDGCVTATLVNALTLSCQHDITVTDISVPQITKPAGTIQVTISGTNLDRADRIRLLYSPPARAPELGVRPGGQYPDPLYPPPGDQFNPPKYFDPDVAPFWLLNTEEIRVLEGTIIDTSNPSAVVVQFDTIRAQGGFYDLIAERDGVCPDSNLLEDAFEVIVPEGTNLLVNGGFETGDAAPWTITPFPENTDKGDPMPGPMVVSALPESPWFGFVAIEGEWMLGNRAFNDGTFENWLTPNGGVVEQSVGLPSGPGQYDLVLAYQLRLFDDRPVGPEVIAEIVIDGVPAASLTVSQIDLPLMSVDGGDPYTRLALEYSGPVASDITVRFTLSSNSGAVFGPLSAIAIDDVQLLSNLGCVDPFADADGDDDVDQDDFAAFQLCVTGSGFGGELSGSCSCYDRDNNGSIDQSDLAAFEACASGPDVPLNPACDD